MITTDNATDNNATAILNTHEFKSLIGSVLFAAQTEHSRFAFSAIRLESKTGELTAVATDGRRLVWRRLEIDHTLPEGIYLLESKSARDLCRKITPTANQSLSVDILRGNAGDTFHFAWKRKSKNYSHEIRLLSGRFPQFDSIIQPGSKPETVWTITAEHMLAVLPDPEDQTAWLFDVSPESQSVKRSAPLSRFLKSKSKVEGAPIQTALNLDYFREYFETLPEKQEVKIELRSAGEAVIALATIGKVSQPNSVYVLMPVNTEG